MRKFYLTFFSILLFAPQVFAANTFQNDFTQQTEFISKSDIVINAEQTLYDPHDGAPIYMGFAKRGRAMSADSWRILKFTYTGANVTAIQSADGIWDNRASLSYS